MSNQHSNVKRNDPQGGRARLGCLGSLFLGIAMVLLVYLGLYPWAFNIGGRFTPWTQWTGYGKLQSSTGATYGLYVRFWLTPYHGRGTGPSDNLRGDALLCTPHGLTYNYDLRGNVKNAWKTTEGKSTDLYLHVPGGNRQKLLWGIDLHGQWRNGDLVLDDKGSMRLSFQPDGYAAGKGWVTRSPSSEHAFTTLAYGLKEDFEALCKSQIASGR